MLRKAVKDDINSIYSLGSLYDSSFAQKYPLEDYLNNEIYFITIDEQKGNLTGFIIGTIIDQSAEVFLIYVSEEYRHEGIGKSLLKSIERNAKDIILEVSKENKIALNLYNNSGYQVIATRPKYYHGVDALVMKKVVK